MKDPEPLVPNYDGYRKLKSFRMAQLVHDVTMLFCDKYVDEQSKTYDRMVQAARSGAQKIADGSHAGETSKKKEMNLTKVARASLEDLRQCYVDVLQTQGLTPWDEEDPRLAALIALHPRKVDDVTGWAHQQESGTTSEAPRDVESMANGAIALIAVAVSRIDRQLSAQTRSVHREANIADRIRRKHMSKRG
ncbi:MAG: four helix bundle protein [Dehalococcoidia bacterium]|nr:four helix bundle protein [Dehalococcoidia bacterium]